MVDTNEIATMMSRSTHCINWTCAEAAGAMAGMLKKLHPHLSADDFDYLIMIGGVLFREGLKEYECRKIAQAVIGSASETSRSTS